jgi:hypothetical protein
VETDRVEPGIARRLSRFGSLPDPGTFPGGRAYRRIDGDPGQSPPVPGQAPENAALFRRPAVIRMGAERFNVAHDFGGHGGGAPVQACVNYPALKGEACGCTPRVRSDHRTLR